MDEIGKAERITQNRVVKLFENELGYRYLGNWQDRANSNVEEDLLRDWLVGRGVESAKIDRAIDLVRQMANRQGLSLYDHNKQMYSLLRYGAKVKVDAGAPTEDVPLIDWEHPEENDFAIAEEVTLEGVSNNRRPDLVLYVNGFAFGVIELKRSSVRVGEGIRQTLSNQLPEFNPWFYSTVQLTFAGNDSQGLRYATTGTPEKYWLTWKEDVDADNDRTKLDKYLLRVCRKDRFIELCRDFVLFDGGVKKVPRVHQYFGIKAAQERVRKRKGGIIWHTQGSGKSIVMVLLARWILGHNPNARVVVITDRDELDKQIVSVFQDSGESAERATSGRDLLVKLGQAAPRLICSLIHKFGKKGKNFEAWIKEVENSPTKTIGEFFVFVDECHRTQSGRLHRAMKAVMPNAVVIGFTGTPLLKEDATSNEVFGRYIHTYTFKEGVEDGVVLDLVYEARDIDQRLGSKEKIDQWFEAKTRGLNDWQKRELQNKWGTMQKVLSSASRMDRVVEDIVFDFSVKPRLSSQRGNAILVASSILEACRYYELFQKTEMKDKCAVVTSYDPKAGDVTTEETGANTETEAQAIYNTYQTVLEQVSATPGKNKTETYEDEAKRRFVSEPASMRLLIVVDKLLTGFDAPPCTYLYIDKTMRDHGLFQAICRTNRLDGEDKDFGYIVDYKNLFGSVKDAIRVYTSEIDHPEEVSEPEPLMEQRLKKARERLEEALERATLLCEPVVPPRGEMEHIRYFCGNTELESDLADREPLREQLYKSVAGVVRAYAGLSDDMEAAGFDAQDCTRIKGEVDGFLRLRQVVKLASGEQLDLKAYEADMRHLIDTYIEADDPRTISPFDGIPLLDLIVKTGIGEAIDQQLGGLKGNHEAVAETIENNVRKKIVKEHLTDPAFFEKMSKLLDALIAARREKAIEYEEYLKQMVNLVREVQAGHADDTPVVLKRSRALRAIYNTLVDESEQAEGDPLGLAQEIDRVVRDTKFADFRGNPAKENPIKAALLPLLDGDMDRVERVFLVIKAQAEY
jgi:type I restriction enzyme, R subunit